MKLAPSILAADFGYLAEQIQAAEAAGADLIHVDVMDGRFVPNISFGVPILQATRKATQLPLDVHLMIVESEKHLKAMAEAGADTVSVHVEACPHLHRTLQEIRALGVRAGVAINPHSPALLISEVLHLVDNILVMTVNPGAGGQQFLAETLPKIRQLRQMASEKNLKLDITVDGGINVETGKLCLEAGATVLVVGSSIFGAKAGIKTAMDEFRAIKASGRYI